MGSDRVQNRKVYAMTFASKQQPELSSAHIGAFNVLELIESLTLYNLPPGLRLTF